MLIAKFVYLIQTNVKNKEVSSIDDEPRFGSN